MSSPKPLAGRNAPKAPLKPVHIKDPPTGFRRLDENEVVARGDYVISDRQEVEPWEGPGGFRADSFVRQIYRRVETDRPATKDMNE
jgi:hypothetical protein